ncbi:MAG: aromatic ring-hydroxylating dioxygenase subunit alpha [Chloroflexi bacterium]|nr:aromatic ring-hydroxylating dioxygenase subunit alpha [Chloroflexota bacterium]
MLSVDENKRLTSIMPGTPMGELFRRYWHPIAASVEMDDRPTKSLRILGEDLVLYKDRSGTLGLIDSLCAHRRVDLSYGIPEEHGLRCMYHGWMFDETGQCIEQPFEETVHPDGRFKEKVRVKAYKVEELAGMIFAYMGPEPAPLLPRWEPFQNGWSDIGTIELPCNWLQCMENSLDPVHLEWLHGYWGVWQQKQAAAALGKVEADTFPTIPQPHKKIGFDVFDYGVIKRRVTGNTDETHGDWAVGHPILFPQVLFVGSMTNCSLQYRIPVDDDNTKHMTWYFFKAAPGQTAEPQDKIPHWTVPLFEEDGRLIADLVNHQDFVAWVTQGKNADRSREKLGESDKGVILYRKLLRDQMDIVADGGEPMGVVRDPKVNENIELPLERWSNLAHPGRLGKYTAAQAGRPLTHEDAIRRVVSTWAAQTPWEDEPTIPEGAGRS